MLIYKVCALVSTSTNICVCVCAAVIFDFVGFQHHNAPAPVQAKVHSVNDDFPGAV